MGHSITLYNQTYYSREYLTADLQPHVDPIELNRVLDAYEMASHVHEFQVRYDASLYFWHITRVTSILIRELNFYDPDSLAASLLHDVLEDSDIITRDVITFNFGEHVAHIVEVLTKNISLSGELRAAEEIRYIEQLRDSPIECKIIKFAERLDNFRCLEFGVKRNPFQYIEETEKLYFPIAEQLNDARLNTLVQVMKLIKGKLYA